MGYDRGQLPGGSHADASFRPPIRPSGRGGLILIGSIVGFQGTPLAGHYAATKAYIQSLAEALHAELAPGVWMCFPPPLARRTPSLPVAPE
jgi:short-subunit dehydrogenase